MTAFDAPVLGTAVVEYQRKGYWMAPSPFPASTVAQLRQTLDELCAQDRPEIIRDKDGTIRSIHGCDQYNETFAELVLHPELLGLAQAIIDEPLYVHQLKINIKHPGGGRGWRWHQDLVYWRAVDGIQSAQAVRVAVLLDDVHEANGPLQLVPESHSQGTFSAPTRAEGGLAYTVDDAVASATVDTYGIARFIGPAGSICAFHPNILHSSADNRSEDRRAMLIITYNSINNLPVQTESRPSVQREVSVLPKIAVG